MKKVFLSIIIIATGFLAKAQIKTPVQWVFSTKKLSPTLYEVHLTATIDKGWHTYSQTTPKGGPVPTSITFGKNPLVTIIGTAKEIGKLEQHHEPLFGVDVKQFSNKLDIVQVIRLKAPIKTNLTGSVDFMVCNDHECLPPSIQNFTVTIN